MAEVAFVLVDVPMPAECAAALFDTDGDPAAVYTVTRQDEPGELVGWIGQFSDPWQLIGIHLNDYLDAYRHVREPGIEPDDLGKVVDFLINAAAGRQE